MGAGASYCNQSAAPARPALSVNRFQSLCLGVCVRRAGAAAPGREPTWGPEREKREEHRAEGTSPAARCWVPAVISAPGPRHCPTGPLLALVRLAPRVKFSVSLLPARGHTLHKHCFYHPPSQAGGALPCPSLGRAVPQRGPLRRLLPVTVEAGAQSPGR